MATDLRKIPHKLFYKIGEVCQYTDTQPYVLRFWESEFPQLAPEKNRTGQRVYRREDIDLILRIKRLLYDEEYTIAGVRRQLDTEIGGGPSSEQPKLGTSPDSEPAAGDASRRTAARLPLVVHEAAPREEPAAEARDLEERLRAELDREQAARRVVEAERDALRERQRRARERLRALLDAAGDDASAR